MQKTLTLAHGYPNDLVRMIFIFVLHSCALGESNLSIRRVKSKSAVLVMEANRGFPSTVTCVPYHPVYSNDACLINFIPLFYAARKARYANINDKRTITLMLLIWPMQNNAKILKMTKTLAHGYSSESSQRELSNEYQHDRDKLFSKIFASSCFGRK